MKKTKKVSPTTRANEFAGVKLHPMTKQRELVACEMGLRYGFMGSHYVRQYFLRDVIIVTWLRSIPAESEKKWSVDRAETEPAEAMKEAMAWAKRVGIGINSAPFHAAFDMFIKEMEAIKNAKGEPIIMETEKRPPPGSGEL